MQFFHPIIRISLNRHVLISMINTSNKWYSRATKRNSCTKIGSNSRVHIEVDPVSTCSSCSSSNNTVVGVASLLSRRSVGAWTGAHIYKYASVHFAPRNFAEERRYEVPGLGVATRDASEGVRGVAEAERRDGENDRCTRLRAQVQSSPRRTGLAVRGKSRRPLPPDPTFFADSQKKFPTTIPATHSGEIFHFRWYNLHSYF